MPGDGPQAGSGRIRALIVGWFSFLHGEATAGDVLCMEALRAALGEAGIDHEVAWSDVMCPPGGARLDQVAPRRYTHLLFVCGPAHGQAVRDLHRRFAACRRIAVGVSVIDPDDPAVTGFHQVVPRDAPGVPPRLDLAARPRPCGVPVAGVVLTLGQREYGERRRHDHVTAELGAWLRGKDCGRVQLDTRLDPGDWRLCATPGQLESILRRLDVVVTTRLHGLVLALKNGVPALAVDPVAGGGKLTAQAAAWRWPALAAVGLDRRALDRQWTWCLSAPGRLAAAGSAARAHRSSPAAVREVRF
jgi:Polysaccharide pyruvyl transferase